MTPPTSICRTLTAQEMKEKRNTIIKNLYSEKDSTQKGILFNLYSLIITLSDIPSEEEQEATPTDHTHDFLAFSRVFSGTLRKGQVLHVLHPRYDPSLVSEPLLLATPSTQPLPPHVSTATIQSLYLLMGRDVLEVESVAPGNIVGIGGLQDIVVKSAALSSTLACTSFRSLNSVAFPIVHVALEAVHFSDIPLLDEGLKLLNQSDPCVKLTTQETGERILSTAGEVHLQRCLDDLRNTYARVEIKVSPPIIPFRETVVVPPTMDMVNEAISSDNELFDDKGLPPRGPASAQTPGDNPHTLKILARPLPQGVVDILEEKGHLLKFLPLNGGGGCHDNKKDLIEKLKLLYSTLKEAFECVGGGEWGGAVDHIWSFGTRNAGTNILLNGIREYSRSTIWGGVVCSEVGGALRSYDNSIISGFRLASLAGPLCDEPLRGVCLEVVNWTTPTGDGDASKTHSDSHGPVSGQLISVVKECCRQAMLTQPTRLMAAMYSCIIQVGGV